MQNLIKKLDLMLANPISELDYKDDFTLLIAIMLSAQTTDKKVNEIGKTLFEKFPSPASISEQDFSTIEAIIRPLGISRVKANNIINIASKIQNEFDGKVPRDYKDLITLQGVGNKTAKVFLIQYYQENFFPVDTHVKRVSTRLGLVDAKDNVDVIETKMSKYFDYKNLAKRHQQFVLHGRYTCLAKKPLCEKCLLQPMCEYFKNNAHQ